MRTKKDYLNVIAPQSAQKNINIRILKSVQIPLPPLKTQLAIVADVRKEQRLIDANRELIQRMEARTAAAIERVWETNSKA